MAKLTVKLKQHTPIIHFQSNQKGATLRATELKPKLDKFLIENFFEAKGESYNEFLIGTGKHNALDYKVKVIDIEKNVKINIEKFPLYFGNMGKETEKKEFIWNNALELYFFSYNKKLIEIIKKKLADFFMNTNFGTRQGKGFGSFYIDKTDDLYKEPKSDYSFTVSSKGGTYSEFKIVFEKIEMFYKSLRSGFNEIRGGGSCIFYFKSLMFLYAKSKGIQWDKRSIKEIYLTTALGSQIITHKTPDILQTDKDKKLMKDLLGLSKEESWKSYRITISKEAEGIDRFKSPIFFKPIQTEENKYTIFFKGLKINENFLGREFTIKNNGSGNLKLNTLDKFDLDEFFEFIFSDKIFNKVFATGNNKYVEQKYQNRYFNELKTIFKEIIINKNKVEVMN